MNSWKVCRLSYMSSHTCWYPDIYLYYMHIWDFRLPDVLMERQQMDIAMKRSLEDTSASQEAQSFRQVVHGCHQLGKQGQPHNKVPGINRESGVKWCRVAGADFVLAPHNHLNYNYLTPPQSEFSAIPILLFLYLQLIKTLN